MNAVISVRIEGVDGKSHTLVVPKDSSVDDLFACASKKLKLNVFASDETVVEDLYLYRLGKELTYGAHECIADYEITNNNDTVYVCVRQRGGLWPLDVLQQRKTQLRSLPGFITVTSDPAEPDMISLDNSTDELRAKMPCGHVISPSSMTSYCHSLLSQGMYTFQCPAEKCDRIWEYFLVIHVACLTPDEKAQFEKKITENYISRARGMQQCPGCTSWCCRADQGNVRVHCVVCSKQYERVYDFCWACRREWIGGGTKVCGNSGCDGNDPRIRILKNAAKKSINKIDGCPSIRACPKCGLLIDHKEGCRHMTCTACNTKFCFICLKLKECSLSSRCPVAPVQETVIGV